MKLMLKSLQTIILIVCISSYLQGIAQVNRPVYKSQANENIVRDKAFELALLRTYYDNPMIYDFHRNALEGRLPSLVQRGKMFLDTKSPYFNEILQNSGNPFLAMPAGSIQVREAERKREFNAQMRLDMDSDPARVMTVVKRVRETMYNQNNKNESFSDVYNKTKNIEDNYRLPNPSSLEALRQQYPEIVSSLEQDGFSEEQVAKFCSGKMTKADFMNQKKLNSENEYDTYITNNFIVVPNDSNIRKVPEITDEQFKSMSLELHDNDMGKINADFYLGISILNLIDRNMAAKMMTAGKSVIGIYDNVKRMSINKEVDPQSLGNVVSFVGVVISMFENGEDQLGIAINKILDNQKKILEKLEEIDYKLNKIEFLVRDLIGITNRNQQEIKREFDFLNTKLDKVQVSLYTAADYQKSLHADDVVKKFYDEKERLISAFENDPDIQEWFIQRSKSQFQKPEGKVARFLDDVDEVLTDMAIFATKNLKDPNYKLFNDNSKLKNLDINQIIEKISVDVNERVAMLPGIGDWLNGHLRGPVRTVAFRQSESENDFSTGQELKNIRLPNPAVFSKFLTEYVDLAIHRPVRTFPNGAVIQDAYIGRFCNEVQNLEDGVIKMAATVPLAVGVLNFHLKILTNRHEKFILQAAKDLYLDTVGVDKKNSKPYEKILYSALSEQNITAQILRLSDDEFLALGEKLKVITKSTVKKAYPLGGSKYPILDSKVNARTFQAVDSFYIEVGGLGLTQYCYKITVTNTIIKDGGPLMELESKSSYDVPVDRSKRLLIAKEIARIIMERQTKISESWKDALNKNPDYYLGNIYRAYFALKTLTQGAYGINYAYTPALNQLTDHIIDVEGILNLINSNWRNGVDVLETYPVDFFTKSMTNVRKSGFWPWGQVSISGVKVDPINVNKTSKAFTNYFEKYATYEANNNSTTASPMDFISKIPSYQIPLVPKGSNTGAIGNLDYARNVLIWASSNPDLIKAADCLKMEIQK